MGYEIDFNKVRYHLDLALETIPHDRWLLAGLRDGQLKVLADSRPDMEPRFRRTRDMTEAARRACFDRRPLTVNYVVGAEPDPGVPENWEADWATLLYCPVGLPDFRPVGILILGSRRGHWYTQDEVDYVNSLAITLTAAVVWLSGPLGRLSGREREVAQYVYEGMSVTEIAVATNCREIDTRSLIARILRKLSLRSPKQLADLLPDYPPTAASNALL